MGCCDSNEEQHGVSMVRGSHKGVGQNFNDEGYHINEEAISQINSR